MTRGGASGKSRALSTAAGSSRLAVGYGRWMRSASMRSGTGASGCHCSSTCPARGRPASSRACGALKPSSPGAASGGASASPGRNTSHCQPHQATVQPWRRRSPSPISIPSPSAARVGAPGSGGRLKRPRVPLRPRLGTSSRSRPLLPAGSAGCRRQKSALKATRPSPSRGARSRSTIPSLAGWAGSTAKWRIPSRRSYGPAEPKGTPPAKGRRRRISIRVTLMGNLQERPRRSRRGGDLTPHYTAPARYP